MSNRQNRSSSLQNPSTQVLTEPEVVRLQRDVDIYTRKVELERKRCFTLTQNHQQLKKELEERNLHVTELKKQQIAKCQRKDLAVLESLKKQIAQYNSKQDQLQASIESTRDQIDTLRKSRAYCLNKIKNLESEVQETQINTTSLESEIKKKQSRTQNTQFQMQLLKSKNEEEQTNYLSQFELLKTQVNRERRDPKDKLKNESFSNGYKNFDTGSIIKRRLQRLILNNKDKVKIIDAYQRNMRVIDEAFNQIKETTGLTDIEEIQSNFIKGEEQNYALLTYLDILNQEIDNLEDINQELEGKCEVQAQENNEREAILRATPDEDKRKKKIEVVIQKKNFQVADFLKELEQIQPMFQEMLSNFQMSKFNTKKQDFENYSENVVMNEGNIDFYLAELDTFTNQLLLFESKKNQPNMFFTNTILLEEVPPKEFKEKNLQPLGIVSVDPNIEQSRLLDHNRLREQAVDYIDSRINQGQQLQNSQQGFNNNQSSIKKTPQSHLSHKKQYIY